MRDEIIQKRGYDSFIEGDELSLKISSYPVTAKYLAERLSINGKTICELCCGVGISLVEFSHHFKKVIGVDIDPATTQSAKENLRRGGIANCEIITGNVDDKNVIGRIISDIVTYDIPYWSDHGSDALSKNPELAEIIKLIRVTITDKIVIYTPPHFSYQDIVAITDDFEYQEVWIDDRHDRNFIYFGNLIETQGQSKIVLSMV